MGLKKWFENIQRKFNPVGKYSYGLGIPGIPVNDPQDLTSIVKSHLIDPWVYISLNVIGKNLSAAPLIVEKWKTIYGKQQWVQLDSGEIVDIIENPNPVESSDILIWKTAMSLLTGNAYWVEDDTGKEIYLAKPDIVKPVSNSKNEIVEYHFGSPNTIVIPADRVIHFKMPNIVSDEFGLSPVQPLLQHLKLNWYYINYINNFFKNGAIPSGILTSVQQIMEEQEAETRKAWNRIHQGFAESHKVAILGYDMKYQQISSPLAEIVVDALYKMPRETILATFSVPPVLAGIFEYANYANAREQIKEFWQNTILPLQRLIAGFINTQYVPRFGDDLRVRFDVTGIEALQEDELVKSQKYTNYVRGGILTPNEVRELLGYDPVDGGDELRAPSMIGIGQDNYNNSEGGNASGKRLSMPSLVNVKDDSPHRIDWIEHYKAVSLTQAGMIKLIRGYFDGQVDRVIDNLKKITANGKPNAAMLYSFIISNKDIIDDEAESIFNLTEEYELLYDLTDPFIKDVIKKSGQRAFDKVNIDMAFNVDNPEVSTIINEFHNRLKNINNTTYNHIKDILRQAYDDGSGIEEIQRNIRAAYKDFSINRARTVARTEMNGMVNGGADVAYKQAGIEKKMWISAFLSTSRQTHMDADGQIVNIDENFIVDGEMLRYPGHPNGSPGNVINCYCQEQPVI